jgi:hypothetical protein
MKLKRDPYFLIVAALFLAGVVLAFVQPSPGAPVRAIPAVAAGANPGGPGRS